MTAAYLARLVARGRGTDAGSQVRALPAVYAPEELGETPPILELEVPATTRDGPMKDRLPEPASAGLRSPQVASPPPHAVVPAQGKAPARSPGAPSRHETARSQTIRPPSRQATTEPLPADVPLPASEKAVSDDVPRGPARVTAVAAEPIPAFAAAATPHSRLPHRFPATPGDNTPTVSIDRIDIVVAPPPTPATPPPDPRTRGFAAYARLRRGLTR